MKLSPEKRFDKNGKLVTRHVRSVYAGAVQNSLPAPITQSAFNDRERARKARQEAFDAIEDFDERKLLNSGSYESHLRSSLTLIDEETALMVRDAVTAPHMSVLCLHLVSDFNDTPITIREILTYRDSIPYAAATYNESGFNYSDESVGVIRGIHEMEEFRDCDDLTSLTDEQQSQVKALISVGYVIHTELGWTDKALHESCKWGVGSQYPLRIQDKELISLVMDNPEQADSICELIKTHQAVDVEFIRESIAMNAPSLIRGAL